jgi:hypothetical protein
MVMIVDDERALVAVAELTLAQIGFKPAGFGSKFERRRAAGVSRATEALRPRVNRQCSTRRARVYARDGQLRADIPIILMSAYAGTQLRERA